jgi:hypothetical protein
MKLWKTAAGRRWRVLGTLAVAVPLLVSLGTTNALAVTRTGAASAVPARSTSFLVHSARSGALGPQSASSAASTCPVSEFGYGGETICGTFGLYVPAGSVANNGGAEAFVIGTDWSIWHAWPGSNGWHSLGGQAKHASGSFIDIWDTNPFIIYTIGTDGRNWCNAWGSPAWSGWELCAVTV